jgi:ribose transport system ATP-binding protein/D-xylose transport system ATP-binding protein
LGSGRTELLQALFGQSPRTGEVTVADQRVRPGDPGSARRAGIALLTEDRKSQGLLFNLPVAQNATLGSLPLVSRFGVIGRKAERAVARNVADRFSVKVPSITASVTHLSGGNQQKLLLGRCLLAQPRVVLLDEPTKGVDVGTRQQIYQHVADLSERGTGVIVVSSELDELLGMSDRVIVLGSGRVVDEFRRGEGDEIRILEAVALAAVSVAGEAEK